MVIGRRQLEREGRERERCIDRDRFNVSFGMEANRKAGMRVDELDNMRTANFKTTGELRCDCVGTTI